VTDIFLDRIYRLFGLLDNEGVLFLTAYDKMQLQADMEAPFLQEASFLWLTGIDQPGWRLIVEPGGIHLIAPDIDETHRIFNGETNYQGIEMINGIRSVLSSKNGRLLLTKLASKYDRVYTLGKDPHAEHYDFFQNPAQAKILRQMKRLFAKVEDCRLQINTLRSRKSVDEIKSIKHAVALSIDSFRSVRDVLPRAHYEYQLEAQLNADFRRTGANGHAYAPIVAAGQNACTLHYNKNNSQLKQNGLVLIDAGARVDGYCADITRTYAIGTPSPREIAVHAAVQKAHYAIIDLIKPGVSLSEYQAKSDEIMKQALRGLDLLKKPEDYRKYFPHAISHGLGIDVHESLGGYKEFMPGMVLTVEPGIYIPEEGIGVRIEDDILVTETGHENLSAALSTDL
jgi:Xaa-Pro aminopeptidase